MELEPDFVVDASLSMQFERTFSRFAALADKEMESELRHQAGLFLIDAMKVTPPFHQGSGQGAAVAKKTGDKSVKRNIDRLFIGRTLVGSRKITHLFGKPHPAAPWVTTAQEKYPDVAGIYATEKNAARTRGGRSFKFSGKRLSVDRRKVQRILKAETRKVGWLAGGWNAAAVGLGVGAKVPAFVRRHGSAPGQVIIDFRPERLRIVLQNQVSYADRVGGLQKRVTFALRKRIDSMQRQIPYLIRRAARVLRG